MARKGIPEDKKTAIAADYVDPRTDTHHSIQKVADKHNVCYETVRRALLGKNIHISGRGRVAVVDKPTFRKVKKDKRRDAIISDYTDPRSDTYHNAQKVADKNKLSYTTVKNILLQSRIKVIDRRFKPQIIKKELGRNQRYRKKKREPKRYPIFPDNNSKDD